MPKFGFMSFPVGYLGDVSQPGDGQVVIWQVLLPTHTFTRTVLIDYFAGTQVLAQEETLVCLSTGLRNIGVFSCLMTVNRSGLVSMLQN